MDLIEYGFSKEETKRYSELVSKKMGSFQNQSENVGGEIEYRGLPFYRELAGDDVDFFTSKAEIDEYLAYQERVEEALMAEKMAK